MDSRQQQERIARRIKHFRESKGLTQQQLSASLGFNDRQTLAAIEAGERQVRPEELASAAEKLGVDVNAFVDPYRLVGEGDFSFRAAPNASAEAVESFAARAGGWIATYRELCARREVPVPPLSQKLDLRRDASFEEAQAAGEALWRQWKLGEVPAAKLHGAVTRELGILVLNVDAPKEISGAASRLPGVQAILVNRTESPARRNYDLAHELFHVLTWDAMPPERVEPQEIKATKGNRVEQLANNFAAALLMPEPIVTRRWEKRGGMDLIAWLTATALTLQVSSIALQWRLVSLKKITKAAMRRLHVAHDAAATVYPSLFSAEFIELVHWAIEAGQLSLRRAAALLSLSVTHLAELCREYGAPLSYDSAVQA